MKLKTYNPYSRDILLQIAQCYIDMTDEQFQDRIDSFAAIGDAIIAAEEEDRDVPPYIYRAIHLGDKRSIRKWNRRRK